MRKKNQVQQGLPFLSQDTNDAVKVVKKDAIKFLQEMPDESVDVVITDPAYSGMNQHLKLGKGRIVGDYKAKGVEGAWFKEFHDTPENYNVFLSETHRVLKPDSHLFLMFDSYSMLTLGPLVRNFFNVKNLIVWDKLNLGMGHYFRRQTELILFACKGKRPLTRRDIPDILRIKRIHNAKYPTQKPVELFQALIASSKAKTDSEYLVCDPFVGSGSSAIAAIRQQCSFIGADISDEAIKISRNRISQFRALQIDILQPVSAVSPDLQKIYWDES